MAKQQTTRHLKAHSAPQDEDTVWCRWFLMCDRVAVTTHPHPMLGDVPVCQRCKDKLTKIDAKTR